MAQYFVQTDSDGYITKALAALTEQDNAADYQLIMIASQYDNQFATNFTKWRISELGVPLAPGNLPKATVEEFNQTLQGYKEQLEAANQTIADQAKQLSQLSELVPQVQEMVIQLTQMQGQTDTTMKQVQQMLIQLTQAMGQLSAGTTTEEGK
ncbi:hypothetical protein [Lentilactobacillus senioris]|uniref:hypothetical protein n=1 Tax=Lentilactobacillus senioris TaxID=931534 RepID=UPI003D2E3B33